MGACRSAPSRSRRPAPRRDAGGSTAASSARYSLVTTVNSVASKNAIAVRASSSGDGDTARRSDVRHRSVISSRSRRRTSRSSDGVRRGSSSRSRSVAQRRRATSAVRRRASVGCAVSTSVIERRPSNASSSASVRPVRRSSPIASATESSRTPSRAARSRRRSARTRPRASTRLTSWKYSANAPMTASADPRSRPARSSSSRRRSSGSSSWRSAIVRRRTRSTSSNSSGPACSVTIWPRSAPISRTSADSVSGAPDVPMPAGSARTAAEGPRRGEALTRADLADRTASQPFPDRNLSSDDASVRL